MVVAEPLRAVAAVATVDHGVVAHACRRQRPWTGDGVRGLERGLATPRPAGRIPDRPRHRERLADSGDLSGDRPAPRGAGRQPGGRRVSALERFLDQAVEAGVDLIQLRERDLDAGVLCRVVRRLMDRARGSGVRVVVNDRADVALAAGADGVHLRGDSPSAARLRPVSPGWIIGRSVHHRDLAGPDPDADYLLFGTVFSTASKPDLTPTGLAPLMALAAHLRQRPCWPLVGSPRGMPANVAALAHPELPPSAHSFRKEVLRRTRDPRGRPRVPRGARGGFADWARA